MITNELISEIKSKINDNHKQAITGDLLQGVLVDMVKSLCEVYPQTYTDEEKAQARANIDALSNYDGEITKEKLSLEVQAILNDVANKQNITDATLATIAKTIVGAINEVYKGGLKDASIATSKIEDGAITDAKIASGAVTTPKIANDAVTTEKVNNGAITEPKLDTDLANVITSAVQPAELASAIATALASYVAKADIVDTTGSATDKVMSQHGVTETINDVTNKVTELDSQIEAEATARTQADKALQTQINGKQEALTLTVKDNGNIVIANIQGQSKEFMPATPSGDPMHYAYVAAGAEYNDTGADIIKTTPWADMLDDDYNGEYGKTVIHKAGYWYLNGLGDITNDEIRKIYQLTSSFPESIYMDARFSDINIRTNFSCKTIIGGFTHSTCAGFTYNSNIIIISASFRPTKNCYLAFTGDNIIHILGTQVTTVNENIFSSASKVHTVKILALKDNLACISPNLSMKSVLYMINYEQATSPITITLHADVYNRCMANADILAALEAHTNISLASA